MIFSSEKQCAATLSGIGYRSHRAHHYNHLQSASAPHPSADSQYGPTKGVLRIAKTLEDCKVPAAFFMLPASAMLTPPMTPPITNSGRSEVALHGYIHEPAEVPDEGPEERPLNQPTNCSAKQTGKLPAGSSAAGWAVGNRTIGIDLLYDSSMANPTRPRIVLCTPAPHFPPGVGGARC
jgi:hypothetical protein